MKIRRQLSLFVPFHKKPILEYVRSQYNPIQQKLIPAHITFARFPEFQNKEKSILEQLASLESIEIKLKILKPKRVGKGLLLPSEDYWNHFKNSREKLGFKNSEDPHLTLMHPRNSECTDDLYEEICKFQFPEEITFHQIHLIEQKAEGPWSVLKIFKNSNQFVQ